MDAPATLYGFGKFELDLANRQLCDAAGEVELGSRYFDALALLVREAGTLVTKERFMAEVWRGIPVTDEALTQCIRTLRRALGDTASDPGFIETVPKHGYRFVATVEALPGRAIPSAERKRRADAGWLAGAATLGGGAAGLAGGLVFGSIGLAHGHAGLIPLLAALGAALGVLGGAGIGLGLAFGSLVGRGGGSMMVPGGAVGGLLVGAAGQTLGSDLLALLANTDVGSVTGPYEGGVLGAASGLSLAIGNRMADRSRAWALVAVLAVLVGALAGALVAAGGGRLLGGSLVLLQQRLADTPLATVPAMDGWAATTGESALFVLAIALVWLAGRRRVHARQ